MKQCPTDRMHVLVPASDDPSGETASVLRCFKCRLNAIDVPDVSPEGVCLRHQRHECQSAQCNPDRSKTEAVNHPRHYNESPSGIECIEIVRHMSFNVGSAVKYCWRLGLKGPTIQELEKAIWYLTDEVKRLKKLEKS